MSRGPVINVTITGDSKDAQRAARDAAQEFEGFGKRVSGFAVGAGAAVTTFAINAIPQLIGFGSELVSLGQSSAIGLAKADTVFGDSSTAVKEWADGINESMGLSDEAVTGLAAGMGDLLVPLGFTRDAAAEMSMETIGLSGALSAWSGGQVDAATVSNILTKAMLGEREELKQLGISINQAEVDERALAIARADGREEITAQDKALATQQLILEKSTDAQAAWADGTMDAVQSQNELKAKVADAKEALARGLLPIVQRVTKWIVDDFVPGVEKAVAAFREKWPQIRAAVQPVLEWLQDTVQSVVEIVTAFWDRFGDRIMTYTRIMFDYVKNTVQNAMTVIQGIIDLVLGVLTGDWGRAWDGIKTILAGVWDQITNVVRTALRIVGMLLDIAWEAIKNAAGAAWSGIVNAVSSAIGSVITFHRELPGRLVGALGNLGSTLIQKGRDIIDGFKSGASAAWDVTATWVRGLPAKAVTAIGNLARTLATKGRELINGLQSGASAAWTLTASWIGGIPGRIIRAIGSLASTLYSAGRSVITGLWNGMKDAWTAPSRWLGGLAGQIISKKGPPDYDATMLTNNGRLIMGGLLDGMRDGWGDVSGFLTGLAPTALALTGADVARPTSTVRRSTGGTIINNWPTGVRPDDAVNAGRTYDRIQATRS